jgi:HEAT repeat protein
MKVLWKVIKIGAWILGVGTILAAVGSCWFLYFTPNRKWKTSSLIEVLADPARGWPRRAAATAIQGKGRAAMLEALPTLLVADTPRLQDVIPDYLLTLEADAVPVLVDSLKGKSAEQRQAAAFWLGAMARACDLKRTDGILMDARPGKGERAADGSPDGCATWHPAVDQKLASALAPLAAALGDSDPSVRLEAARAVNDIRLPKP